MKTILFCGGGSAGHVVPNLALMRELRYTHNLLYMGTGGIEEELVGRAGYPFFRVDCPKLVRSFTLENFKIPFRLRRAKKEALALLEKKKPDLVFSKGGFASYPAAIAAHRLGIPVLTHESDLSPGLTTRLIAKKCTSVLTSFAETASLFSNGIWTGSPVRREVLSGERARARKKYGFSEKTPVLLVFGGGSGSRTLDEALLSCLQELQKTFSILHISKSEAPLSSPRYFRKAYEADMGSAYAAADVVLCRAGSNTVFEVLALKKRALLVPLAHASRGDQEENALYFERRGLVRVLRERELSRLPEVLPALLSDRELQENLSAYPFKNGTEEVLKVIAEVLASGGARE